MPVTPLKEQNKPKTAENNRTPITRRSFERVSPSKLDQFMQGKSSSHLTERPAAEAGSQYQNNFFKARLQSQSSQKLRSHTSLKERVVDNKHYGSASVLESRQETSPERKIGIDGYFVAQPYYNDRKGGLHCDNWKNYKLLPRGKKSYLDDVIADAKKKLSPQIYAKQFDWREATAKISDHGHIHKYEFRKSKKETLNEEIIRKAKNAKTPAPGAYEVAKFKVQQIPKQTSEQLQMAAD